MHAYARVDWPLNQIIEDARSSAAPTVDFEVVQAAYSCVAYLDLAQQLEYLQ